MPIESSKRKEGLEGALTSLKFHDLTEPVLLTTSNVTAVFALSTFHKHKQNNILRPEIH